MSTLYSIWRHAVSGQCFTRLTLTWSGTMLLLPSRWCRHAQQLTKNAPISHYLQEDESKSTSGTEYHDFDENSQWASLSTGWSTHHIQTLPARIQMPARAGPIISVVTACTTVSCHNSSSSAGSNRRRSGLSAYITVTYGSHAFAVSGPTCWNALPPSLKVTVAEISTVL